MEDIVDSGSKSIKLSHSYALIPDTLKRIKVEEDDMIVIKDEVFGEDGASQTDEYFHKDVPSVTRQVNRYLASNSSLLSELCNDQTDHLEFGDNCNVVDKIKGMKAEERICRLCFKMCDSFKTIDGDSKSFLDVLLPGIDLSVIQEPVMCTLCAKIMFESFDFKARCLCTHNYLIPFFNKRGGVKLNLQDIYMTKNKNCKSVPQDEDICGFCMNPVKNGSVIFIDVEDTDNMLKKTLEQCVPELDLSIIDDPVICASCHASLENHCRFVRKVMIVEEAINKLRESLDINNKSQMELSSLLQCIIGISGKRYNGGDGIQSKQLSCDGSESVNTDVEDKCNNSMDIDDLKFNKEEKFTPTNMLDCEIESNEIGAIKVKCGLSGIEIKGENAIEMEDQKVLLHEELEIKTEELDFIREKNIVMAPQKITTRLNGKRECCVLPNIEGNLSKPHTEQKLLKKNVRNTRTYQCECCPYHTGIKYNFKIHLLKHKDSSKVASYKCNSCSYRTKYKHNLKSHLLKHTDFSEVTTYKCDFCVYQTLHKNRLKIHLLKHQNPEMTMHKCVSCEYQTIYKSTLKRHLLIHKNFSEVRIYKCDLCEYQTIHKNALNTHLLTHKDPSEMTMHKCVSCKYQTKYMSHLKRHLLKHKSPSDLTMYKCDLCVYQTRYKYAVKTHLLKHKYISEVTMYKCDSCLYQTKYKSHLKTHLLIHKNSTEVTMHKCDSCAFQTTRKESLTRHLLQHKSL